MRTLFLAVLASALVQAQPASTFQPDVVKAYKHTRKGDLQLHIFRPPDWRAGDRRPAIVFFFGGGWVGGSPAQFYPHSRHFASLGMVAISAEYRTQKSHGTDPFACIADGKSAIRWVRAHAVELGVDPHRIVAAGGSAGGHVAASTGVLADLEDPGEDLSVSSAPNAMVLFNPVIDTTEKGYGAEKLGRRKLEASPVDHVRKGVPPTIIFHGTADTTVPFENVQRFQQEMTRLGNRCVLIPYEGKKHGFFNYSRDKAIYADTLRRAGTFLEELGYLKQKGLTAEQAREWRSRIRSTLFVPDPLPALDATVHGRFEPAPGVIAERVTYGTEFGMRVPAILYLPKSRKGRIPALIVVNGHGGDKYSWYAFYSGILYARGGAAVLTYDPIGEGERNIERKSGTRAHDKKEDPPELGRRMGGLMMTDVMQAVSYLISRKEVDPSRIGAMGYSMGSFVLSLTCAVEQRLKTCVLVGGGDLDSPNGYWDNSKPMCQGIPYRSMDFLGDRPAAIYALHALRGPTLVYNGLADTVVAIPTHAEPFFRDLQTRTADLLGSSEGVFETGFVPGASHRPYFVTRPVALWLQQHLDFPNWTSADIEAMPDTRIGDWARANNVAMDRLYATEEREGGVRALGTGVPALTRAQLSVFTAEQWQHEKDRLIYERWMEKAKQAASGR